MATQSSTLAWKISWMEETSRLQSKGSQRVGHDWATKLKLMYNSIMLVNKQMEQNQIIHVWLNDFKQRSKAIQWRKDRLKKKMLLKQFLQFKSPNSLWPYELWVTRFHCPWNFPGKNGGVSWYFLLQGIFQTQEFTTEPLRKPHGISLKNWLMQNCTCKEKSPQYFIYSLHHIQRQFKTNLMEHFKL